VRALVRTVDGVFTVDVDSDEVEPGEELPQLDAPAVALPLLVAASSAGSTVIAVVDRRPPLMISHDAGTTWHEAGFGLPAGRAVAIAQDDPDLVLYGARNRLYVSSDGGRFWAALTVELPEIQAVAWAGTITAG
jgi:photosystem II stability/assembly factor-like uncharacterized protein